MRPLQLVGHRELGSMPEASKWEVVARSILDREQRQKWLCWTVCAPRICQGQELSASLNHIEAIGERLVS